MTNKSKSNKGIIPALLVIDVQNKYMPIIPERDKGIAIFFINLLIDLFRKHDFPIIRIYHHNKENGNEEKIGGQMMWHNKENRGYQQWN